MRSIIISCIFGHDGRDGRILPHFGFEKVSTVSEEAHNAGWNVPLEIVKYILTIPAMYITASLIVTSTNHLAWSTEQLSASPHNPTALPRNN